MAEVEQALVAIGGRATRLRGVPVRISKAMLGGHDGRPLLYWCLRALEQAGIRRIVLAAHTDEQERAGKEVQGDRAWAFEDVTQFRDVGAGVHGIPHQARRLLEDAVLFEAGHSVLHPDHYRALIAAKERGVVVASAFVPRDDNPRFATVLAAGGRCVVTGDGERWALAHPMVIDQDYVRTLRWHDYRIDRVLAAHRARGALRAVRAEQQPVEFDVLREYRRAMRTYADNAAACREGAPWLANPRTGALEITQEQRPVL